MIKKTKILFLTTSSLMLESFVLPLARYLKEKNYYIELACTEHMPRGQVSRINLLREQGFVVHILKFDYYVNLLNDFKAILKIAFFLKKNRYDIIHIQSSKAGFLGRIAAKLARIPIIIYTANDFYYLDSQLSPQKRLFYYTAEKISSRFCDVLLFISNTVLNEARKHKFKSPDKLIYLGPPTQDYKSFIKNERVVSKIRNKYKIKSEELLIGCAARLVHNKGIDTFIRTAAKLKEKKGNVKFIIIGDGPLYHELKELVNKFCLNENLIFTGFIEVYSDVLKIISSLDIFFLPTRREGFGLVFAEALAFEVPVVGPDISPINEFIHNKKTGLLCKVEDIDEYVKALLVYMNDKNFKINSAKLGRKEIVKKFNQIEYFQNNLKIYSELLNFREYEKN